MTKTQPIKIALIDDHQLFREGLFQLIDMLDEIEIIGMYQNGKELLDFLNKPNQLPDVLLMDIEMPVMDGFETLVQINALYPDIAVIYLSAHANVNFIERAIALGAFGFLTKDSDIDSVKNAIEKAKNKTMYYNEHISQDLITNLALEDEQTIRVLDGITFTKREIEYLQFLCKHLSDREIAELMYISPDTAIWYRKKLMQKISVNKVTELYGYAIKHKLFE